MLKGNRPAHPSCQNPNCLLQNLGPFSWTLYPSVSWRVRTSSSGRETAVFKGHSDSTTPMKRCKFCTPAPFPRGVLLPHHTPGLVFCAPTKPVLASSSLQGTAFLWPATRRACMKISKMVVWQHQLAQPAQRWPVHVMVNSSGCPGQLRTRKLLG